MSVDASPDGNSLVFDLVGHVYKVSTGGGEAACLTCDVSSSVNFHPRWSPDGAFVAFISDRDGQANLWVMDADGANPRPVFLDVNSRINEPTWAADGKSIIATRRFRTEMAFYRMRAEIWRFPLDGSEPKQLVAHDGQQRHWPSVSKDGVHVYFHTMNSMGQLHRLQRLKLSTGIIENVTKQKSRPLTYPTYAPPLGEAAPEIGPNGRYLAFIRKVPAGRARFGRDVIYEGRTALWLRDLDTGSERIIMDPVTPDAMDFLFTYKTRVAPGYGWSKDGKHIYISESGKIRKLAVASGKIETIPFRATIRRPVKMQARALARIGEAPLFSPRIHRWPSVSAEHGVLAFQSAGQIYTWDMSTDSKPVALMPMPGVMEGLPAYSSDGKAMAFVSYDANERGFVWIAKHDGDEARRISRKGQYSWPIWGASNDVLYVSRRGLLHPPGQPVTGDSWEVLQLPIEGGSERFLFSSTERVRGIEQSTGCFYTVKVLGPPGDTRALLAAGKPIPETKTLVSRIGCTQGGSVIARIKGEASEVVVSPDSGWIAIRRFSDLYVAQLNDNSRESLIDVEHGDVARVSTDGGVDPNWVSSTTVGYFSGNEYREYDVQQKQTKNWQPSQILARPVPTGDLVIRGGTIITGDVNLTEIVGDLHVRNGRIECIGSCAVPKNSYEIEAHGKFVMPGWVDIHTHHLYSEINENPDGLILPKRASSGAYLAFGVTTTSDPGTPRPVESVNIRDMTEAGMIVGPRTLSQGAFIRCPGRAPQWNNNRTIDTLEDARSIVSRHLKWGATLLKSYQQCTRTQRELLARAAREAGIGVTVEAQDMQLLIGAITDGNAGWEHWLQYPVYSDLATFFGRAGAHYSGQIYQAGYPNAGSTEYWVAQGDWWKNERIRRFTPWRVLVTRRAPSGKTVEQFSWRMLSEGSAAIANAGGYTPVGGHSELPGIDAHWEVWALAWGLGNARALRAASYDGAHFLGLERDLGSLETGKLADFSILSKNPLENIRHTTTIETVVKGGQVYDASSLDQLWPNQVPYGDKPWMGDPRLYETGLAEDL